MGVEMPKLPLKLKYHFETYYLAFVNSLLEEQLTWRAKVMREEQLGKGRVIVEGDTKGKE